MVSNGFNVDSNTIFLDPHIHSKYSHDAKGSISDIIDYSIKIGLNAIAISDHNTIEGSKRALIESKGKNIIVIPSIEVSTETGHIVALGASKEIEMNLSAQDTIDEIHSQGAIAIVPHPFFRYRHGLLKTIENKKLNFDAIEVKNSRYLSGYSNKKAKKFAIKNNIPQIGASDAHFIEAIGSCSTKIDMGDFDKINTKSILESIKMGNSSALGSRTSLNLIGKEFIHKKLKKL